MDDVIEVQELTKVFGDFIAVDHITFTVKRGEIFGLLGPNGAGKSTTIKMLTTLLNPTSGSARICGFDVVKERDKVRSCLGIVFQDRSVDRRLTGRQNLDFHARMYSMSREEREKKIEEVLDLLELKGKENITLSNVPEGIRRRFEVARGFMTYPEVVFLDEPTIGFDIKARMDLWDQIKRAKQREGATIVLTTHFIDEADYLCDRIAIIDQAKIVALGTSDKLKEIVGTDVISLELANHDNDRFIGLLKGIEWVERAEEYGNSLLISVKGHDGRVPDIIDLADQHGFQVISVDEHRPSLEDVFLHFTGRTIREAEGNDTSGVTRRRR